MPASTAWSTPSSSPRGRVLIAAVRWWRPDLPRRWAAGYALLVFALFAVPLVTSPVQVPVDIPYHWRPWHGTLDEPIEPHNALLADVPLQVLPFRTLVRERLLAGEAPLWANELGTGQPLLGNAQSAPFAPLHLMALPVPPLRALTVAAAWQVLVGLLLAHALALALMRSGGVDSPATRRRQLGAAVTAVAFALSAYAIVWLYHPLSMVASFVPGLVLGIVDLARGGRRSFAGLVACAVAMAVSGHPETVAHAAVVAAGMGLVLLGAGSGDGPLAVRRPRGGGGGPGVRPGRPGAPAGARDALGERAPELHPAAARQPGCARRRPRRTSLLPLVQPLAFGSPRDGDWHGPRNLNELCSHYAGLLTLALALAGAALWRGRILAIVAGGRPGAGGRAQRRAAVRGVQRPSRDGRRGPRTAAPLLGPRGRPGGRPDDGGAARPASTAGAAASPWP